MLNGFQQSLLLNTWSQGTLLTPKDELNGEIEPVSCFKCHMSLPVLIPPRFWRLELYPN